MKSEGVAQLLMLQYLERRGDVAAWRNNTGAYKKGRAFIRYGYPGSPDIIGVWRGRFLGIEMKSDKGQLSPDQIAFKADIEAAGGLYIEARSVEDVERVLAAPANKTKFPHLYPRTGRMYPGAT